MKKFCENFETGPGKTGLPSKFQLHTAQLEKAAVYIFVGAVSAFTVVNGVLLLKPAWTRLMRGNSQSQPSASINDSDSKTELLKGQKGKENEEALAQLNARKPPDLWNTVLFFPDPDHNNPEMPDSSTKKLLHLFECAQLSIKMCIYGSSYRAIVEKLAKKFQEGLIVHVCACDYKARGNSYCQVNAYTRKGIPVRMKRNLTALMHHKFVLIDDEAVITGSLNWTTQEIARNHENVLVTTDPRIVLKYRKEFALLWNDCEEYRP